MPELLYPPLDLQTDNNCRMASSVHSINIVTKNSLYTDTFLADL